MNDDWLRKFYDNFETQFSDKKITRFSDGRGYSLIDTYPQNVIKQMSIIGSAHVVPFVKFYLREDEAIDADFVPLTIDIHITVEEVEGDNTRYVLSNIPVKRLAPIDLVNNDDYFISRNDGYLYEKKRKGYSKVDFKDAYVKILKSHTSSLITFTGIYRRLKLLVIRSVPSFMLSSVAWLLGWLMLIIKGERYTYDVVLSWFEEEEYSSKNKTHATTLPTETIDFFGYKVSVWTITSYSLIVIIAYLLLFDTLNKIPQVPGEGLSIVAFAIASIVIYDRIIPRFIQWAVRESSKTSYNFKHKAVKL